LKASLYNVRYCSIIIALPEYISGSEFNTKPKH
jgi:hypothetical protein